MPALVAQEVAEAKAEWVLAQEVPQTRQLRWQEPLSLPVFAVPGHAAWPIGRQRAQQPQH